MQAPVPKGLACDDAPFHFQSMTLLVVSYMRHPYALVMEVQWDSAGKIAAHFTQRSLPKWRGLRAVYAAVDGSV